MEHRIVWVHGIGDHAAGFSDDWRLNLNHHLRLPSSAYLEVLWEPVFDALPGRTRSGAGRSTRSAAGTVTRSRAELELTSGEALAAQQIEEELATLLQARKSALDQSAAPTGTARPAPTTRSGGPDAVVEWAPSSEAAAEATTRGLFTWLFNPDEYLGDFVKYLAGRSIRTAVKERFKEQVRPLVGADLGVTVISHSWGTVVAYDSLLDLSAELPELAVVNLFTLGSPLWLVRRFLEDGSGRKPRDVDRWINVTARGDLVGSWLRPAFAVDHDLEVPSVAGADAHGSYFVAGNDVVQRDILAHFVERP